MTAIIRFSLTKFYDDQACQNALLHLFGMFLLGSRNMRILDVPSDIGFLDIVLDVLQTNPECFDKLEEIEADVDYSDDAMLVKILEVSITCELKM
jgi:hypothetical protein